MARISFWLSLALALACTGCGYSTHNSNNGNGPKITELMPSSAISDSGAFTLTIEGTGFGNDSVVYFGTMPRTTTFDAPTEVKADITAADVANPGSVQVYVRSGGANSNAVTFVIQ